MKKKHNAALAFILVLLLALPMLGGTITAFADSTMEVTFLGKYEDTPDVIANYDYGNANIIAVKQGTEAFVWVIGPADITSYFEFITSAIGKSDKHDNDYLDPSIDEEDTTVYWVDSTSAPFTQTVSNDKNINFTITINLADGTLSIDGVTSHLSFAQYTFEEESEPAIDVEKYVWDPSGDGSWADADSVTGPNLPEGTIPQFKFVVSNTGDLALSGITLVDNVLALNALDTTTLAPGEHFEVTAAGVWVLGQHTNLATVTGSYGENRCHSAVSDEDPANFWGYIPQIEEESEPAIDVEKYVWDPSGDGSWADADSVTGPNLAEGTIPQFKFVVTNTGDLTLSGITLGDNVLVLDALETTTLAPGEHFEVTAAGVWVEGQHSNLATANGSYGENDNDVVSDEDPANFWGYIPQIEEESEPAIDVEKYVWDPSGDGSWADADSETGPSLPEGTIPQFKFVVTNTGDLTLSGITLGDNTLVLNVLETTTLAPDEYFEVTAAGVWVLGQHTNIATVTGLYDESNTDVVTDSDPANFSGYLLVGDDPEPRRPRTPTTEIEIVEDDIVLGDVPADPIVDVIEEEVPLGDVPQTGDSTNMPLLITSMMASLAGLVALTRKKKTAKNESDAL